MENLKIIKKIVRFQVDFISIKLDLHKLKKFIDLIFIFSEIIISKLDKLLPYYLDYYSKMVEKEIVLANISERDKILHIGGGTIPATAMLYAQKTRAKIIAIDKNLNSIKKAKKLVFKNNLSSNIIIEYGNALNYQFKNFNLVVISMGINPYKELLYNISKSIDKDTRIVLRTTSDFDGNITEDDEFLREIFDIKDIVRHERNGLLVSVLLLKKYKQ